MEWVASVRPVLVRAVSLIAILAVGRFLYRGYKVRMSVRRLRAQGIPTLPHSLLMGHIPLLLRFHRDHPADAHFGVIMQWLARNHRRWFPDPDPGPDPDLDRAPPVLYLDVWPVFPDLMMMVLDARASAQFTQHRSLPKHPITRTFLEPLTDNLDMTSADGALSKTWRSRFNPSFSPRNITLLIPELIDEILVFRGLLEQMAGGAVGEDGCGMWGDVFQLEEKTTNLTFDVILRATMDVRLHEQTTPQGSPLKQALISQIQLMSKGVGINHVLGMKRMPWESLARWRNNKVLRRALLGRLEDGLTQGGLLPGDKKKGIKTDENEEKDKETKKKTILSLALERTLQETNGNNGNNKKPGQDAVEAILANLKLFLFAGHDTTSSTICWMFKLLQDNPASLARLRAEHDEVLGADPARAAGLLRRSPQLLSRLAYTHGVVKETLRFYPLASTVRQGEHGFSLSLPLPLSAPDGPGPASSSGSDLTTSYPTGGCAVHDVPSVIQMDPAVWPRAAEFLPERWLVGPGDPLHPARDAWRPFSMGPRNCIGLELAMVEVKLVAALVCRDFDIQEAWGKWDLQQGPNYPKPTIDGQRLYGAGKTVMHPKDGMPVHVRRR